jgi:pyruvate/2-oxoglutarate dehydrogenase complex dihydrolipoamide dehydrogenase (E3) component
MEKRFDAVVIGNGQGDTPLVRALAKSGLHTALVERNNYGCTPTKTMVASARVAYLAARAADYGVKSGMVGIDMHRMRERSCLSCQESLAWLDKYPGPVQSPGPDTL